MTTQVAHAANDSLQSVPPTAVPDATHAAEVIENATSSISIIVHDTLNLISFWLIIIGSCVLVLSLIGLAFVICRIEAIIYFFVAIGWLVVIGLWFLGGIFLLIYAVFGDTCAAINEWTANPRNGTAFDIIVRCELNHTRPPRARRHASMGELPSREDDEVAFPEYKPLSDLSHLPALPSFPEHKPLKDIDDEVPFPEYKSVTDSYNPDYELDDPNDANPQKRDFWMELTIQQKDAATENESCTILRTAFVPIFENISVYNCPNIIRNTMWVTLAMITLSGGTMFSICLWVIITRRSTMRLRKMVPVNDQLPFYAYVFQEVPASTPTPVPKKNQYAGYYNSAANSSYNARPRRSGHFFRHPAEVTRNMYPGGRRRK